jgi:hypothetical protein
MVGSTAHLTTQTHLVQFEHPRVFGAQVKLLLVDICHRGPAVAIKVHSAHKDPHRQVQDTRVQQQTGENNQGDTQTGAGRARQAQARNGGQRRHTADRGCFRQEE